MPTFASITSLPSALIDRLATLGITTMTSIQSEAITPIIQGTDIVAQSKTGSGKTLAFGIPCVVKAEIDTREPETLIITPTRELAEQIAIQLRSISTYRPNLKIITLYGGVSLRGQADSIATGAQIIIGTPGRLMDHLGKHTLDLDSIKRVVLDEADKMLDMGFGKDIDQIVRHTPPERQMLLFSATFPETITHLTRRLMKNPLQIAVDIQQPTQIREVAYKTHDKERALDELIGLYRPKSLLVFCNTKAEVVAQTARLRRLGHSVTQLHGDLDQRQRQEALIAFVNGSRRILVATDIASRGLDIRDISLVINYDLPSDADVYIHRIGRTGRADSAGEALSLYTNYEGKRYDYILRRARPDTIDTRKTNSEYRLHSQWVTICINGGKRHKLRPGDILGTLSKAIQIPPEHIGKITITETISYIALKDTQLSKALNGLQKQRIKKKRYKGWILE